MDLIDLSNYNSETLNNLEIVSSFFVDIFYNHLYLEGKKLKLNNETQSVTEGYKLALKIYLSSLNDIGKYKQILNCLIKYFIYHYCSRKNTYLEYSNALEIIILEFVPDDYYNSLSFANKGQILKKVITSGLNQMILKIYSTETLKLIIDYHDEKDNIKVLQDDMLHLFLVERETIYKYFIVSETNNNSNINPDNIKMMLVNNVKSKMKNLEDNLAKEKKKNEDLINIKKYSLLKISKLIKLNKNLEESNKKLKEKITIYKKELNYYKENELNLHAHEDLSEKNNIQDLVDKENENLLKQNKFNFNNNEDLLEKNNIQDLVDKENENLLKQNKSDPTLDPLNMVSITKIEEEDNNDDNNLFKSINNIETSLNVVNKNKMDNEEYDDNNKDKNIINLNEFINNL